MRSKEERVVSVKRRSKELERESKKRMGLTLRLSSAAACLAIIVGLSFAMPGVIENFSDDAAGFPTMTASVFQDSGALGYIVIGLLAFALGVCVTVLCYQTRRMEREENAEKEQRENDDD